MSIQDLISKSTPISVTNLSGGLNSTASGLAVEDNESTDCQNMDFNKFGSAVKRNGYTLLTSSVNATTFAFVDSDPDTITDSGSGFSTAGFEAGDTIVVSGSTSNDGTYTVDTVAAGTLTLDAGDALTAEAAGDSVTIKRVYAFNSGAAWTGLHYFELITGTDYLMGVCGNEIAKMDSLDGTWDDITGDLTVTAGNNNLWSFVTFNDTVGACNGVDAAFKWTGTGNAAAMTVPTNVTIPKWIEIFNNYTFIANMSLSGTASPSLLYWSNINTLDTWTDTDTAQISKNDGQQITGLKTLGEELIIFKERSIWKALFTGDPDVPFVIRQTRSHVGCVAGHSISKIDNGLVFRSTDGWYYFDGTNSFKMSDRVTTTLESHAKTRNSHISSIYLSSKNRMYSSATLSGNTTHDRVMTWDSFSNAWSQHVGMNANCWTVVNTAGEERIYFGDYSGYVYRADTGTDDYPANVQTAIDAYYYTKWFHYNDIVNQKGTPHVYIYYQSSNSTVTFAYSYEFESSDSYSQTFSISSGAAVFGTAIYGTDTFAGSGGGVKRRDIIGRGRVVRFKFANAIKAEQMVIDGFGMLPHLETMK